VRPVEFDVTVTALLCPAVSEPAVELRLIHEADSLAVQFSVPCPVLVMFKVCDPELVAPSTIVNDRESGPSPMIGGGGATVSVAEIC
jgi:hypothetical protein